MAEKMKKSRSAQGSKASTATASQGPSMKQRTLFDSFLRKNAPEPIKLSSSLKGSVDQSSSPPVINAEPEVQSNALLVDISQLADELPSEPVVLPRQRSPSVIEILDDARVEKDSEVISIQSSSSESPTTSGFQMEGPHVTEGRSPNNPITIASSPVKPSAGTVMNTKPPPQHPFFQLAKPKAQVLPSPAKRPAFARSGLPALFPSRDSQHVKGHQTMPKASLPQGIQRIVPSPSRNHSEPIFNYDTLKGAKESSEVTGRLSYTNIWQPQRLDVPSSLDGLSTACQTHHPAIEGLTNLDVEDFPLSQRPWTEKWRPYCAQNVLGNEKSAIYLRSWLRALELQLAPHDEFNMRSQDLPNFQKAKAKHPKKNLKRPRVVRAAEKPRKKARSEDNWIVHTDEESSEDEIIYDDEDVDVDVFQDDLANPPTVNGAQTEALGQLHNTILLTGPPGSGKTACVYACAEELGWEVFEVYPGIGKRNGTNVEHLIGEVGKNHLVHLGQHGSSNFFKRGHSRGPDVTGDPSTNTIDVAYSPRKKPHSQLMAREKTEIRQSLVLLEEVDVLFKQDVNFWSTITRIIKECKRPVICTCNDISLVPLECLPLQKVLEFDHCPKPTAVDYLKALCQAEGFSADESLLFDLCSGGEDGDMDGDPRLGKTDLRRSINAAQLACTSLGESRSVNITPALDQLAIHVEADLAAEPRLSWRQADYLSFLDSSLELDVIEGLNLILDLAPDGAPNDDEIGYMTLHDWTAKDRAEFSSYDRHREITSWSTLLARGLFGVDVRRYGAEDRRVNERRKEVVRQLGSLAERICPFKEARSVYLEYVPIIRQIVEEEDKEEEKAKERAKGRKTRNSIRSDFARTLKIKENERTGLLCTLYA